MAQATIRWRDRSNNELGFAIERCTGSACTGFVQIATVGPNITTYTDTGLADSTSYRYRIKAFNHRGNSTYSNIITVTTLPVPTPVPVPETPPPTPTPVPPPEPPPSGTTLRYVSLSGNDLNNGTINFPWRTIRFAVSQLLPGYGLIIRGGLWTGAENTIASNKGTVPGGTDWTNPIYISGYVGETVVIQPPSVTEGIILLTPTQKYLIFQDFCVDMINNVFDDQATASGIYSSGSSNHVRYLRLEVKNNISTGITFSHNNGESNFNEVLYCQIHDNGVRSSFYNGGYGMYVSTSDNLYEGNDIYNNNAMAIQMNPGVNSASRNIIRKNRIHDNKTYGNHAIVGGGAFGIVMSSSVPGGCDGNLVYDNLIYHNGYGGVLGNNYSGIALYNNISNSKFYNNTIYDNTLDGFFLQYYGNGNELSNNIVFGNLNGQITDYGGGGTPPTQTNNLTTNPQFQDAANANFHLIPTSPAINAGITLSLVPDDFSGIARPVGTAYSIGAFER